MLPRNRREAAERTFHLHRQVLNAVSVELGNLELRVVETQVRMNPESRTLRGRSDKQIPLQIQEEIHPEHSDGLNAKITEHELRKSMAQDMDISMPEGGLDGKQLRQNI